MANPNGSSRTTELLPKYFESKNVKIYPCTYRGYYQDSNGDGIEDLTTVFDPESRLISEYNFTHLHGIVAGKKSYVVSKTDSLLCCVIGGYYFELNLTPAAAGDTDYFSWSAENLLSFLDNEYVPNVSLTIHTRKVDFETAGDTDAKRYLTYLSSVYAGETGESDTDLDFLDRDTITRNNPKYYNTAIAVTFDQAAANSKDSTESTVLVLKKDGELCYTSFLRNLAIAYCNNNDLAVDEILANLELGRETFARSAEGGALAIGTATNAYGQGSIALGIQAQAANAQAVLQTSGVEQVVYSEISDAIAIGNQAIASADASIALGGRGDDANSNGSEASAKAAIAIGSEALADRESAIAFGAQARANSTRSIAIGSNASASFIQKIEEGSSPIAIGSNANAQDALTVAIGDTAKASKQESVAVGSQAEALGYSTALGAKATANQDSVAVGAQAAAEKLGATAVGKVAKASNKNAVAFGYNAEAAAESALAIGASAKTYANEAITIGLSSTASGEAQGAISIGQSAQSSAKDVISIGSSAKGSAPGVISIGPSAQGSASGAISIGQSAQNNSAGAISIGQGSKVVNTSANAKASDAIVLGREAIAAGPNSVVLGAESSAGRQNNIIIGANNNSAANAEILIGNGLTSTGLDSACVIGNYNDTAKRGQFNIATGTASQRKTSATFGAKDGATIYENLKVEGNSHITGTATIDNATELNNKLTVTGTTSLSSAELKDKLTVAGATTLNNKLTTSCELEKKNDDGTKTTTSGKLNLDNTGLKVSATTNTLDGTKKEVNQGVLNLSPTSASLGLKAAEGKEIPNDLPVDSLVELTNDRVNVQSTDIELIGHNNISLKATNTISIEAEEISLAKKNDISLYQFAFNMAHPVNSIFMTVDRKLNTPKAVEDYFAAFGVISEWEAWGTDRVPRGASADDTAADVEEGLKAGADTVTLTSGNLPSHGHNLTFSGEANETSLTVTGTAASVKHTHDKSTCTTAGSHNHNMKGWGDSFEAADINSKGTAGRWASAHDGSDNTFRSAEAGFTCHGWNISWNRLWTVNAGDHDHSVSISENEHSHTVTASINNKNLAAGLNELTKNIDGPNKDATSFSIVPSYQKCYMYRRMS